MSSPRAKILVVDDEQAARQALAQLLETEGFEVRSAPDGFKALGTLAEFPADVLLTDLRMPIMDGLTLIKKAGAQRPNMACVVMTAYGSVEKAVEAMKAGADDFLLKPVDFDAVLLLVERNLERQSMRRELDELRQRRGREVKIIGSSPAMREVTTMILQVAPSRATVLISGESGTGKELAARLLHQASNRANRKFVAVNCAALAETLLESELFGHERGAFTGATSSRKGRFEEADGGTLFLDEVGEISPPLQVKLLRFLQEREFERVGGNRTMRVDVRVVTATNQNLEEMVVAGDFRKDLYYRLNVIRLDMPPLRARRSDIALLAHHFIAKYAAENRKTITGMDEDCRHALESHDWPGNVRELENVIERAVVLADTEILEARHLPSGFGGSLFAVDDSVRVPGSTLADIERFAIMKTFESTGGSTADTATILGISVRKVQYKLKEYRSA